MKKVYEASSPGCSRVSRIVIDLFSSRTMSAFSRYLTLVCFAVLGVSSVSAQGGGCPGGACSITCPADISLCLAPDNYGHTGITPAWVASYTSSPNPACSLTRVWKDAMGMEEQLDTIWKDCSNVGDHVDLWVSREKPGWTECRSSLVKVRVWIKDCEPPSIACPPMGMYVCDEGIPRPGTNYSGYKFITPAQFAALGGSAADACGLWGILYKDQVVSTDPVCKTNRVIKRTFWAYDVNGNSKSCMQDIVVADNVPPTFTEDPADLVLSCDCIPVGGGGGGGGHDDDDDSPAPCQLAAITAWLAANTNPGNQSGQDAVVVDNCSANMVMITAVPGTAAEILNEMPAACDPNPREVIVVFTANDGCGNQSTRSAKVRFVDNVEPTVPPIQNSYYSCASDVPPAPNTGVVIGATDNCTPSNKLTIQLINEQTTPQGCPNHYTLVRTYRITDCDGNYKDRTHTIYVNDEENPYWNPAPQAKFMMDVCDQTELLNQIQAWLNDNGGGTALDNCGTPTVTYNKTAMQIRTDLLNFCATPGNNSRTVTVMFTATDACGNSRTATANIRLMDTQAPNGTPPAMAMYDCADDVPQMLASQVTGLTDNCSPGNTVLVAIEANPPAGEGCVNNPFVIIRRWRLTDCAGNTRIVSQMIQVKDQTPPSWTNLPDDISISCTNGSLNTILNQWLQDHGGSSAALDQCSGSNLTYYADVNHNSVNKILNALGPCAPKAGMTTVTFYAKDDCGNTVSATAKVTVYDNTPPTATPVTSTYSCPSQVPNPNPAVISDESDACSPNPPTVEFLPNATQNNGGTGCMASPLIITRWYKLTDCSGNTSSVSHRITVVDMQAPQALCKALTRNLDHNGMVMVNASEFDNGSFDNCGIKKIQIRRGSSGPWYDKLTFDCSDIPNIPNCGANVDNSYIITIQMLVTDNCDQTDYCTTTITIKDEEPPTITCPSDMTFYTSDKPGYDCRVNATWNHPVPHDNCSVMCYTMEVQKMINGQFVTVNPANDFPTPNLEINVLGQTSASYMFSKGPYCTDNQYKIIYRVRDEHGNNKPGVMCMFFITIKDNEAPLWNDCPQAPIVAQTVTNDCYQMKCWKRPTAYDNCEYPGPCPPPTVVVTVSDPTVMINQVGDEDCALFPVGRTVVTYTATDAEGNSSTCTVEVLISDPQPPVAMCAGPFTVNMEPDGVMQLSVADIDAPGTMDNCGICAKEIKRATSAYGPTVTLTCADVGTTVAITMRVKDCSNPTPNEATCVAMVTVQDMQLPGNAYCPADTVVATEPGVCSAHVTYPLPTFNDGCGSPKLGVLVQGPAPGGVFLIGNTTVKYSYTSASGYTVYCTFVVTVEDRQKPTIVCPANVTNLTCLQALPAPLTLAGGFTGGTLTDNCGVTALENSEYDNGLTHCPYDGIRTIVRTYVAFDAAGNSATCAQTFSYIEDTEPPVLTVKPLRLHLDCIDDVPAAPYQFATDNCGVDFIDFSESAEPGACLNQTIITRRWVAYDYCGNSSEWEQEIDVYDSIPPVLAVTPLRLRLDCIEDVPAAPYQTATDNCGVAFVDFSESEDPGDCLNQTIITRRWVAYDECGNTTEWEQEIIVHDTIPPVLSATPVDRNYACIEDVEAAPVQVATDNCGVVTLNFEETENPGPCLNQTVIIRRWYAYDLCGNTVEHWQTITVNDDVPPYFTGVPADANVTCATQVPALVHPVAHDNCKEVNVDFAEYTIPGDCHNSYTVVRRWVATDLCGNQATVTQVINVSDQIAPTFNQQVPPAVVNVSCAQDVPAAAVLTATDNCDGPVTVIYSEELKPGDCGNKFSIVRTWTAEDLCSNLLRYTQTINVYDGQAPVWDQPAPPNVSVECSEQVPAVPVQTATDNCAAPVIVDFSEVVAPGTCPNQFTVIRTWHVQDDCGNATTRVQVIVVSDILAPVWDQPAPASPVNVACSENVPPVPVQTATDNCAKPVDINFNEVINWGTCTNQFQVVRTWTAADDCGNITTRVQVINVSDTEAPVWDQPAPASPVNVSCSENVPPVPVQTATDNCGKPVDLNFNEVINWGTCTNQFQVVRTWTAADDCGNITTRVQVINVSDTQAPVLAGLPAATVNVECSEQVPAVANVTATDNCVKPIFLDFSEVEIPGTCPNQYVIKRTWFAQDDCGNSTVFTQTITISDTQAPVLSGLPAATVNVSCSENVPAVAVVTATDNCAAPIVLQFSEVEIPGTCPNQYVIKRTWSAQDDCGNSTVFTQTITISDTQAPVFAGLPAATVNVSCSENVPAVAVVTATDNCNAPVDVELSEIEVPGTCPNQYSVVRTWTAEDDCGNITSFVQTINVNDTQAPVLVGLPTEPTVNVSCSENVPAVPVVTATDNCIKPIVVQFSEVEIPGTCPNQYSITRTWSAQDDCGNSTFFVQTINISDTQAPVMSGLPTAAVVNISCSESTPVVPVVTATDNCIKPIVVQFSEVEVPGTCPNQYAIVRTWTAQDDCGNSTSFVQTINVSDTQAPVMTGLPANVSVSVSCSENVPAYPTVTATDNCNAPIVIIPTEVEVPGTCPNQYTLIRTWTAQDDCGNSTSFVQTITINDTQAPSWNQDPPASPINVKCAADVPSAPAQTATDNCNAPVYIDFSETVTPGNCLNRFTLVRTWVAQDDCGNSTVRQQLINVNDDIAPVITCPGPLQAQCSPAEIPPYANLNEFTSAGGTASDNCGLNVNSFGMISEVANGNVYTRTYRVTDQCGNSAACTQTVTVMDTQPPVFLNCPNGPLVFGNDPDKCSAKINWPNPVAVDNCSIPTVVQTGGPTAGSIVAVGTYTVTFKATDAMGNMSTCSFVVMVMDTQNPEFDADIVMPADVTVQCDAVPAPFVLTTNDVHDNCTPSNLLVITYTQVRTDGNCKFNYILTRTWKVTDEAGNMLIHTQKITVVDTKAPTALCKNATVTLDKFGNATVTPGQINNGSFDNCSAQADLTLTVTPSAFTCANLGPNVVTLTVTDECGNSATCTATVTVLEGPGPCTPQYTVTTSCLNNATTLDNGQFIDLITVKSLAMQTWTLVTNTGLYATTSPAPPAAPVALPIGTAFTAGTADGIDNDGDGQTDEADEMVYYTLKGIHVEAIGYTISIKNNLNVTATIHNKGYYPTPYFINLNDPFCINTPPFVIQVGETNNAQGTVISIMVDGVSTNIFNAAALGLGAHTVMAVFDAGGATTNLVINGILVGGTEAQALADPGCQQKITKVVQVVPTPTTVVCNDLVQISLHNDGGDCVFIVEPDDVLEGTYGCFDDYSVVLTYPFGTHSFNPPNRLDYTHIGKTLKYSLVHANSGNVCWGQIKVEDKEPPALTCPANITVKCSDPTETFFTGSPLVSDCSTTTSVSTDDYTDFGSCSNPRAQIIRTWVVTDASGNQSTCSQKITIAPFDLADVVFPADVTLNCENVNSTDPNATGVPTINGSPIGTGGLCMASISKTDEYYDICPGSYELIRTWKVRNMCLPVSSTNPIEHVQVIKVVDTHGPAIACPNDITVSTDPFNCCATVDLPDVIISEGCSNVTSLTYKVVGYDLNSGNIVLFEGTGHLGDFAGNNYWNPDTLGIFGLTPCLPLGEYTVTYTAVDGCENVSKCTFTMVVEDLIPPVAACDEFTQVALGGDGMAFVNAYTFNDGSYDVCNPVYFKARRMNSNVCQSDSFFYDQVKFCCSDINDTILVVFRVYDIPVENGPIALDFGAGHYNDCMVQVFVEDKIKPICSAPANVTVSCENFDPSLWAYGAATAADNCCVDTITETRNYGQFDTVCNKGTIVRNFRAFDCGGQQSQCSQRIYVKFPDDRIVTTCDGTGNYGEPSFYGEDCELLGVSFEDEIFTVVPDACYKIERTWTIINWCTYNPNAGCIYIPNPNPSATVNSSTNLTGPTVSACGTPAPWAPTITKINPTDPTSTNFCTFWDANANCYKYKQIIKIIDTQAPVIHCPPSPAVFEDKSPNDAQLWNESYWWDNTISSHDLCEGQTDLCMTASDLCSGSNLNIRYLLFLDLNNDGTMETVISSTNLPGYNTIYYGNAATPNFAGGTARQFDERPVPANQKYGFTIQMTVNGDNRTACVRWNTQQQPSNYVVPELPYGTHKIKWIIEDGCGNESVCEYNIVVEDKKAPTVVCVNGLSVNIMPTKMITLWASDFLKYTEDNCTPADQIKIGIRKAGAGTGFPTMHGTGHAPG